ncbi:21214_t:CDS:2, partial [Entrophospora sp. SA101]
HLVWVGSLQPENVIVDYSILDDKQFENVFDSDQVDAIQE